MGNVEFTPYPSPATPKPIKSPKVEPEADVTAA